MSYYSDRKTYETIRSHELRRRRPTPPDQWKTDLLLALALLGSLIFLLVAIGFLGAIVDAASGAAILTGLG